MFLFRSKFPVDFQQAIEAGVKQADIGSMQQQTCHVKPKWIVSEKGIYNVDWVICSQTRYYKNCNIRKRSNMLIYSELCVEGGGVNA